MPDNAGVIFTKFQNDSIPISEGRLNHAVLKFARLQASVVKAMRTALFWAVTQRVAVITYRRFGKTYLSHLHWVGSIFKGLLGFLTLEDGIERLYRNVGKEIPLLAA